MFPRLHFPIVIPPFNPHFSHTSMPIHPQPQYFFPKTKFNSLSTARSEEQPLPAVPGPPTVSIGWCARPRIWAKSKKRIVNYSLQPWKNSPRPCLSTTGLSPPEVCVLLILSSRDWNCSDGCVVVRSRTHFPFVHTWILNMRALPCLANQSALCGFTALLAFLLVQNQRSVSIWAHGIRP